MADADPQYDRQAVVGLVVGDDEGTYQNVLAIMSHAATYFGEKGHTAACFFDTTKPVEQHLSTKAIKKNQDFAKLKETMKTLTRLSRLYIVGHGDWQSQRIASWNAKEVAKLLVTAGMPKVRTISLVACQAGRNMDGSDLVKGSANSFGSQFHKVLSKEYKIKTVVYARVHKVRTYKEGAAEQGRKLTRSDTQEVGVHHQEQSKKKFYWSSGKQVEEWVKYQESEYKGSGGFDVL
jgi:hypothetical protein